MRPHEHISRHWNNVAEQVLDRVRVLAANPYIDLELVVLLMDILFGAGGGWRDGMREMKKREKIGGTLLPYLIYRLVVQEEMPPVKQCVVDDNANDYVADKNYGWRNRARHDHSRRFHEGKTKVESKGSNQKVVDKAMVETIPVELSVRKRGALNLILFKPLVPIAMRQKSVETPKDGRVD
jgi:hypothetical protein